MNRQETGNVGTVHTGIGIRYENSECEKNVNGQVSKKKLEKSERIDGLTLLAYLPVITVNSEPTIPLNLEKIGNVPYRYIPSTDIRIFRK